MVTFIVPITIKNILYEDNMNYSSFIRKFEKFQDNNQDLINEFEDGGLGEPLNAYASLLYDTFMKYAKLKPQADVNSFLDLSLRYCVNNEVSMFDALDFVIQKASSPDNERGTLQQYFNDIGKAYERNNNDYNIEYCPENRNKLIEMNLKTVISIAKGYQGLGLSLEDLIGAGNLGLVESFDKYDPKRATLKTDIVNAVEKLSDDCSVTDIIKSISSLMKYGKVRKKFIKSFSFETDEKRIDALANTDLLSISWKQFTKQEALSWIKQNVKNATFNSVAYMWIRAYILIELDSNSRLVKKSKADIQEDREKHGAYQKEIMLDIDAPMGDDSDTRFSDMLYDEEISDLDAAEARESFDKYLNKLLDGVKSRDRAVFLKKFGIGKPRELSPKEIAKQENLSIARVSQILQKVMEQVQANQVKFGIDPDVMFEMVSKIKEQ